MDAALLRRRAREVDVVVDVLLHVIAPDMRELVMRSLGVLDVSLGVVLTYYFGSSGGSKNHSATMAQMASGRRRVP